MKRAKLPYYTRAATRLLVRTDWPRALRHSAVARRPCLALREGPSLRPRTLLDVLVAVETVCFDAYGLGRLSAPRLIVDVGAGIGDFAIAAALRFPDCRVLAFEPHARAFLRLAENVQRNGVRNVEAQRVAVGDPASRSALHTLGGDPFPAETRCLSDYLPRQTVDLLKVDCEGAELDVLASVSPAGLARVRCVSLEYHRSDGIRRDRLAERILLEAGFAVSVRPDQYDPMIGYLDATRAP